MAARLAQLLVTRAVGAGLGPPSEVVRDADDGEDALTIYWAAHNLLCRVEGRFQCMAVCGWGARRSVRKCFRGEASLDQLVSLLAKKAQSDAVNDCVIVTIK